MNAESESLYLGKGFLVVTMLFLAVGDVAAEHRHGLRRDVEERGDGVEWQLVHDAWTALHQQVVTLAGGGAMEVDITFMELAEDMLADNGTHLHRLHVLSKIVPQALTTEPQYTAEHHCLDGRLRRTAIEEAGIVGHELTLEREPRNMRFIVADAPCYILEASALYVSDPLCRFALSFQQFSLIERQSLTLALAELPQFSELLPY